MTDYKHLKYFFPVPRSLSIVLALTIITHTFLTLNLIPSSIK